MRNSEIDNIISGAYEKITPDVLGSVLADCENNAEKIIIIPEKRSKKNMIKRITGIAAAAALLLGAGIFASVYAQNNTVSSIVSLDVNPSVEIRINSKEKVLTVNALNDDGKLIIGDMDFKGNNLDVTVNALIGSMLRNGYLSDITNSILVSVDGKNEKQTAELRQKVADEIAVLLETNEFTGAVLSQTVSADDELKKTADSYGITAGKAQLIEQIISQNTFYTFEELAPLSINELNLISMSGGLKLENVSATGQASDKAYIGEAKAKEIALNHASVQSEDIYEYESELEYEHGIMIYDIEFKTAGVEYDYEINAVNGEVIKSEREQHNDHHSSSEHSSTNSSAAETNDYIGYEKAKATAIAHAGVNEADIYDCKIELDKEHDIMCYEIEFKCGAYEYEYNIDAANGSVLKHDKEYDDDYEKYTEKAEKNKTEAIPPSGSADSYIGYDKAKSIAFTHANVKEADVFDYEIKLDSEKGVICYEVSFKCGSYEYEYDIDAANGNIIKSEKEFD